MNQIPLNREHKNLLLKNQSGRDITQIQRQTFPKWFKEQVRYLNESTYIQLTFNMNL